MRKGALALALCLMALPALAQDKTSSAVLLILTQPDGKIELHQLSAGGCQAVRERVGVHRAQCYAAPTAFCGTLRELAGLGAVPPSVLTLHKCESRE